jgi:putative heme-binding domain-containing protein
MPPRCVFTWFASWLISGSLLAQETATAPSKLKLAPGFQAELLYSVPKAVQGSWVAMTADPQGRLIVSDQDGALYRFRVPAPGAVLSAADVKKIDLPIGYAQGLLHAFGSLYVVVNSGSMTKGLYRVRDTDGDDAYDEVKLLRQFADPDKAGEHGPHSIVIGPDGKSIYVVCGNQIPLPDYDVTRTPPFWGEDEVVPRIHGRGFMRGVLAPRGCIAKTDPEGKSWEIVATGFRNPYDAAFNRDGELFAYDADMEWDLNTPWYRPTRVNHVVSGAEFGWRNGSHKWPDYYVDSFGAVINIGPGSPTGVTFGYGAKFPAKYQEALFICDWSFGKMYAVHLNPSGSSYVAEREEFLAGQPLPLTDVVVHPIDGALYVAVGGRKVQSGLYRITYTGKEATDAVKPVLVETPPRQLRHRLEALHSGAGIEAISQAWPYLGSPDRGIRHAARVALEHQPFELWKGLAVTETEPTARLAALVALARVAPADKGLRDTLLNALNGMDYRSLSPALRLDWLRAYELTLVRHCGGFPADLPAPQREAAIATLDRLYPTGNVAENLELTRILANLGAASLPAKAVELLKSAPSQEEQIGYATNIRLAREGWTPQARQGFLEWLVRAQTFRGGANLELFIGDVRTDFVAGLSDAERKQYAELLNRKATGTGPQFSATPRDFVKPWVTSDFNDVIHVGLEGNRNFENGRRMFGAANCYACHRFNDEGGAVGPDLSSVAGKFSPMDLLESIIEPSKEISDQYGAMIFELKDGKQVSGRIGNLKGEVYLVSTNMFEPGNFTSVPAASVKSITPSPISMMPPGLLYTLKKDDVLDLLAYLLSKGNPEDPMFH